MQLNILDSKFMQHFKQKIVPFALHSMWITNSLWRQDQAEVVLRVHDILHIPFAPLPSIFP